MKSVIGGIVLVALAGPALANEPVEYWVEFNWSTHQCSIVEKKANDNDSWSPQEPAAANPTPNAPASSMPNIGSTPTMLPASSSPAQVTVVPGPSGGLSAAAGSAPPATKPGTPAATPGTPAATNPEDTKKDPYAATEAAYAKKRAELEASGKADIQTEFIGTAQHTREQAQAEIQIMRKCGVAN